MAQTGKADSNKENRQHTLYLSYIKHLYQDFLDPYYLHFDYSQKFTMTAHHSQIANAAEHNQSNIQTSIQNVCLRVFLLYTWCNINIYKVLTKIYYINTVYCIKLYKII